MAKTPIETFKSEEEFTATCEYWKNKLYLTDWIIKFELADDIIKETADNLEGINMLGECSFNFINKQALIQVDNTHGVAELTLVHELLHLLIQFMSEDCLLCENIELERNVYKDAIIHQSMEQMAKTLLMVKYPSIDKSFFVKDFSL